MEEALFLARFGSRVTVIHRRDELRASKIMGERAQEHEKIEFLWDSVVDEVLGDGQKVTRDSRAQRQDRRDQRAALRRLLHRHRARCRTRRCSATCWPWTTQGYLVVQGGSSTEIPGVFVAGDVHDHTYRQAITAAGAGCRAAIDCERWLEAEGD